MADGLVVRPPEELEGGHAHQHESSRSKQRSHVSEDKRVVDHMLQHVQQEDAVEGPPTERKAMRLRARELRHPAATAVAERPQRPIDPDDARPILQRGEHAARSASHVQQPQRRITERVLEQGADD